MSKCPLVKWIGKRKRETETHRRGKKGNGKVQKDLRGGGNNWSPHELLVLFRRGKEGIQGLSKRKICEQRTTKDVR